MSHLPCAYSGLDEDCLSRVLDTLVCGSLRLLVDSGAWRCLVSVCRLWHQLARQSVRRFIKSRDLACSLAATRHGSWTGLIPRIAQSDMRKCAVLNLLVNQCAPQVPKHVQVFHVARQGEYIKATDLWSVILNKLDFPITLATVPLAEAPHISHTETQAEKAVRGSHEARDAFVRRQMLCAAVMIGWRKNAPVSITKPVLLFAYHLLTHEFQGECDIDRRRVFLCAGYRLADYLMRRYTTDGHLSHI